MGVSPQSVSEWMRGRRQPNLQTLLQVAAFLDVPGERLLRAEFVDLLGQELKDRGRFDRVEAKIGDRRRGDGPKKARRQPTASGRRS